jgi:hypothetical protein
VAAHAEIVVRAPNGDFVRALFFAGVAPHRHREAAGVALEIGEDAILEALLAVHRVFSLSLGGNDANRR